MEQITRDPVDTWIKDPVRQFISNSTAGGAVLFLSALLALILSNSPWADQYLGFWELEVSIKIGELNIERTLHHWINDGLVAVFFFVVGLELKRELIAGELSDSKSIILPIAAAIAGIAMPAGIYLIFNPASPTSGGWGIPIATDIAFALGVVYLLGDRVPLSLKVFLTTLAIVDDLVAVLIIAVFYTSNVDLLNLGIGAIFLLLLVLSNKIGIRSTLYYALLGIAGLWYTFLISGIHPTVAAVLLAFTIPARPKVSKPVFSRKLERMLDRFRGAETVDDAPVVSEEQLEIVENIREVSKMAVTPLQRLEHGLHPFVSFVVMPVFALSNAGVTFSNNIWGYYFSPVSMGVFFGLLIGKVLGIGLMVLLLVRLKVTKLPAGMNYRHVFGVGILAGVGFTMSLFISGLAFSDQQFLAQAKLAILTSSVIASISGYFLLRTS